MTDDGKIKCKKCNGRGERRVKFHYKGKTFYYYSKCGHCSAKGYLDWVEIVRGRRPGLAGMFVDIHPAGSIVMAPKKLGGCSVYDGHKYVSVNTLRGEALWNELVGGDDDSDS